MVIVIIITIVMFIIIIIIIIFIIISSRRILSGGRACSAPLRLDGIDPIGHAHFPMRGRGGGHEASYEHL